MEKIIIWGVRKNPPEMWEILKKNYEIVGWVDKNKEYHGKVIKDIKVYSPEEIDELSFDKVVVGAAIFIGTRQIMEGCLAKGIKEEDIITKYVLKTQKMSPAELFMLQHKEGAICCFNNFKRINLLIQYAFVGQFYGANKYGYELANKYMELVCEDDRRYNHQYYFEELIRSIDKAGFSAKSYISVNRNGQLIDGTHRLAIGLWKKEKEASIDILNTDWNLGKEGDRDVDWMRNRGDIFSEQEIRVLQSLYEELKSELIMITDNGIRKGICLWEKI